jgi:hypothetical protein
LRRGTVALLGVLLVVVGISIVARADDGLVRERVVVDGIPVETVRPPGDGPFPGVVVVHGFSGSGRLMDGIGIAFAQAGWLAAMPDLPGHGTNLGRLESAALEDQVLAVADWLAGRDDVAERALLGHSMGAGAVTRAAAIEPDLPVVALSLPDADDLDDGLMALFLVGSSEPARFGAAAAEAGDRGYPTQVIAGAEHISILFRTQTLRASVEWLDDAVGRTSVPIVADWRMLGVGLAYAGSAVLFWPLSAWAARRHVDGVRGRGPRLSRWLVVPLAGVVAGGVLAAVPGTGEVVPLLVGGYLAAFFALTGAVGLLLARRWERPFAVAVVPGLAMGLYAAVALGVPAQLAWAPVSLAGPRAAAVLALAAGVGLYAWVELLVGSGYGFVLGTRLVVSALLAGLAVVGAAPGFLTLLVPLVVVVLAWFGAYGVRTTRLTGSPLAGAAAQAPAFALLVAMTTPLA